LALKTGNISGPLQTGWINRKLDPETRATVQDTLAFAHEQLKAGDVAFFNVGLRVYPGTPLEEIARREGLLSVPARSMLKPVFYTSPQVELSWMQSQLDTFLSRHMTALGPRSIRLPYLPLLYQIGHRLGVRPPLWRHTGRTRRLLSWMRIRS
jgi:hypothetical protein